MGASESVPLPERDPNDPYFMIFFTYESICFVTKIPQVIEIIKRAIQSCWSRGIQRESEEAGTYVIYLNGCPFSAERKREKVFEAKLLCLKIVIDMYSAGYDFLLSSDLHSKSNLSTWFFKRSSSPERPAPKMFCLSLSGPNKLQLIGADHDQNIKSILQQTIRDCYKPGMNKENDYAPNFYAAKLLGMPWWVDKLTCGEESAQALTWGKKLLLALFSKFSIAGYRIYATGSVHGETDSFFFMHDSDQANPNDRYFCMISLNEYDKLGLIECPVDFAATVREAIGHFWPKGLQNERVFDAEQGSELELHFNGKPWLAEKEETVFCRSLLLGMFEMLRSKGWRVECSLDISGSVFDKSVFLFRSCIPISLSHCCLYLGEYSTIRTILAPKETIDAIRNVVVKYWPRGIRSEEEFHGSHQIVLNGLPFKPEDFNEEMHSKLMMCQILRACCENGWSVIASADVSAERRAKQDRAWLSVDVDSWFLVRAADWVPAIDSKNPSIPVEPNFTNVYPMLPS